MVAVIAALLLVLVLTIHGRGRTADPWAADAPSIDWYEPSAPLMPAAPLAPVTPVMPDLSMDEMQALHSGGTRAAAADVTPLAQTGSVDAGSLASALGAPGPAPTQTPPPAPSDGLDLDL